MLVVDQEIVFGPNIDAAPPRLSSMPLSSQTAHFDSRSPPVVSVIAADSEVVIAIPTDAGIVYQAASSPILTRTAAHSSAPYQRTPLEEAYLDAPATATVAAAATTEDSELAIAVSPDADRTLSSHSAAQPFATDENHDTATRPTCRLCYEGDEEGELIVPCLCSGTSRWIHRSCLDRWRAVNVGAASFSQCGTCMFQYAYQQPILPASTEHTVRYRLLILRDVLAVLVLIQVWLIVLGAVIGGLDAAANYRLRNLFTHISPHPLYYLFSVLISLALFGLFGILASMFGLEERLLVMDGRRPGGRGGGDSDCNCFGNCDCGSCDGGGDDDGCGLLLLLLLVFAAFGVLYGLFYGSMLVERIMRRHVKEGWYRSEVEQYRVVDWNKNPRELANLRRTTNSIII